MRNSYKDFPHSKYFLYTRTMRFEHLIEINDPKVPFLKLLSREQLWLGLLKHIEDCTESVEGVESCTIVRQEDNLYEREIVIGGLVLRDKVILTPIENITILISKDTKQPGGTKIITIEEPEHNRLFLRFTYERTDVSAGHDYVDTTAYLKMAYQQADIFLVRWIRSLYELDM